MWCWRLGAILSRPKPFKLDLRPFSSSFVELGDVVRHMHDHLALATTNEQSTILNVLVPKATSLG